ncbi:hypothetical protein GS425_11175 [Rhodococcus hoagii]|nr:hypothetical protein [Prescottella equi]
MLSAAHSWAATREMARMASLAAAYDAWVHMAVDSAPDAKLITEPSWAFNCS